MEKRRLPTTTTFRKPCNSAHSGPCNSGFPVAVPKSTQKRFRVNPESPQNQARIDLDSSQNLLGGYQFGGPPLSVLHSVPIHSVPISAASNGARVAPQGRHGGVCRVWVAWGWLASLLDMVWGPSVQSGTETKAWRSNKSKKRNKVQDG